MYENNIYAYTIDVKLYFYMCRHLPKLISNIFINVVKK